MRTEVQRYSLENADACAQQLQYSLSFKDADAEQEAEEKLVLLEQRSADVAVNTVGEMFVQVGDAVVQIVRRLAVHDRLSTATTSALWWLLLTSAVIRGNDVQINAACS